MRKSELRKLRELEIESKLDKFGFLTGEQLRKMNVGGLGGGSVRNVHRVMREMESCGAVVSKHVGVKLYGLPGCGFGFWEHKLMLVDFLISRKWWDSCVLEVPVRVDGKVVLRADAGVRDDEGSWLLIEADRRQKKKAILEKISRYKELDVKFMVVTYRSRGYLWENCCKHFVD